MSRVEDEIASEILDAAKYLRHVRPVSPEELTEYVAAEISADTVRAVLRAAAYELEMRERDDGMFVPVPVEPVTPEFSGIDSFPESYHATIGAALEERYGPRWYEGESGDRLRAAIRSFKANYFAGESVNYDTDTALGYAIYHVPSYYASIQYVLDDLAASGLCPSRLRVLDVGAGAGGPALGFHDYLDGRATVQYEALEPSAAAGLFRTLMTETGPNFTWSVRETPIEAFEPTEAYDLILLANVVSELADPVEVLDRLSDALTDDGALICIAPADRRTSLGLRAVERAMVDDRGTVDTFSPTLRLWDGMTPTDECWSFDEHPPLAVPRIQRQLDEGARSGTEDRDPATGEFVHVDVRFSYAILRPDGRRRVPFRASREAFVPFAESDGRVTQRLDLATVKLSRSLAEPGERPVYRLGDGSQDAAHFGVVTDETQLNRPMVTAEYGDVLAIRGGLLLWNADEEAFNVVIDEETIVDRIGPA